MSSIPLNCNQMTSDTNIDFINNTYLEQTIIDMLLQGQLLQAQSLLKKLATSSTKKLSADSLTSSKYQLVCLIAIITRALIERGYPIYEIYRISDALILMVDGIIHQNNINVFIINMLNEYAEFLKSNVSYYSSISTQKVMEFVEENIYNKINKEDIASALGKSYSYLSSTFHKETGKTIQQFTQQTKINEAKHLLVNTNLPLEDISFRLCFCSQSHFGHVFKIYTGLTPKQYQKINIHQL